MSRTGEGKPRPWQALEALLSDPATWEAVDAILDVKEREEAADLGSFEKDGLEPEELEDLLAKITDAAGPASASVSLGPNIVRLTVRHEPREVRQERSRILKEGRELRLVSSASKSACRDISKDRPSFLHDKAAQVPGGLLGGGRAHLKSVPGSEQTTEATWQLPYFGVVVTVTVNRLPSGRVGLRVSLNDEQGHPWIRDATVTLREEQKKASWTRQIGSSGSAYLGSFKLASCRLIVESAHFSTKKLELDFSDETRVES